MGETEKDIVIKIEDASFTYCNAERESVSHVHLDVHRGQVVLLTGASGCGKTTVVRMLNGLIPHYYEGTLVGTVEVCGHAIAETPLEDMARFTGTVFQNPRSQFFTVNTTTELAFGCENQALPEQEIRERINKTKKDFAIEKLMNRNLFSLSCGEKQKIACASIHTAHPDVILLDEPSANLDYSAIADLRNLVHLWKQAGKTVVVAEHRISYIWGLCDRVVIMKDGRIERELSEREMSTADDAMLHSLGLRSSKMDAPDTMATRLSSEKGDCSQGESVLIRDLHFSYTREKPLLDIHNLSIPMNQIVAVTGLNGNGKTSFLECLCGMQKKARGTVIVAGKQESLKSFSHRCFMVMQEVNHQLFTESVLDEVLISMDTEDEVSARSILKTLDIEAFAEQHPMSLSGGQKQRLAIACAVASEKEFLLLDEPTSGLDYAHMMQFAQLLSNLRQQGKSILVATHDTELIKACCTAVITM
ncbi:MAG: ABC transporter ATP-binding protein [Treponema sp.]|nr:ABC transporter ATP-binding protein [Treponema sp.]